MNNRQAHRCFESVWRHLTPHPRQARVSLLTVFALIAFMPGCERRPHQGAATNPVEQSQTAAQTGTISADPNPVPAGPGKGKTIINWSVNEGTGQVYLSIDGREEKLFSGHSGAEAPWIEEGHTYEFSLYAGEDHKTVLGTVKVTRSKQ